jgi:hypothetical protein
MVVKVGLGLKCTKKIISKNLFFKNHKKSWVRLRLPQKFFLKTQSHYGALKVTGNRK